MFKIYFKKEREKKGGVRSKERESQEDSVLLTWNPKGAQAHEL